MEEISVLFLSLWGICGAILIGIGISLYNRLPVEQKDDN
jgi:hypothetical protein